MVLSSFKFHTLLWTGDLNIHIIPASGSFNRKHNLNTASASRARVCTLSCTCFMAFIAYIFAAFAESQPFDLRSCMGTGWGLLPQGFIFTSLCKLQLVSIICHTSQSKCTILHVFNMMRECSGVLLVCVISENRISLCIVCCCCILSAQMFHALKIWNWGRVGGNFRMWPKSTTNEEQEVKDRLFQHMRECCKIW